MGEADPSSEDMPVGYKRPPQSTRSTNGRSGNPKGRPKARHRQLPYDTVLGQMVTVRADGCEKRVTAAEAFFLQLARKGLQGDNAAARSSLAAIETACASRASRDAPDILRVILTTYGIGAVLRTLGIGVKRYPLDKQRVRWELQPWIAEEALSRFAGPTLTYEEQREVWRATRMPNTINWPAWWAYRG